MGRNIKFRNRAIIISIILIVILGIFVGGWWLKNQIIPKNIGVINGQLAKMPNSQNAVSSQSNDPNYQVESLPFKGSLEASKEIIKEIIGDDPKAEIITETKDYLHVVYTTPKMQFHDDVEFYFDSQAEVIHYRSASRVGYSDMGLNRERYNDIYRRYTEQY